MLKRDLGGEEPIGLLIAAARHRIKQAVGSRVRPYDLTTQQFWVLVAIYERPGFSLGELAAHIAVASAWSAFARAAAAGFRCRRARRRSSASSLTSTSFRFISANTTREAALRELHSPAHNSVDVALGRYRRVP